MCFLTAVPRVLSAAPENEKEESFVRTAPAFPSKGIWVNSPGSGRFSWKQKVTLVYFWDYTTINCLRELRMLDKWTRAYEPLGLEVIYVHAPEFEFAGKKENVEKAALRLGIKRPIFLDEDAKMWGAYGVRSWPTKYLVNDDGKIVETRIGEGGDIDFEIRIREELLELNPGAKLPEPAVKTEKDRFNVWDCGEMSTELYTGYKRAGWWGIEIANRTGVLPDQVLRYKDQGKRLERGIFLHGEWGNREEYLEHTQKLDDWTSYIGGIYLGAEVYGVLSRSGGSEREVRVYVRRDNAPVPPGKRGADLLADETGETFFVVEEPRLYYLIQNEDQEFHEIKLMTRDPLAVYVFSFANFCLTEFDHR